MTPENSISDDIEQIAFDYDCSFAQVVDVLFELLLEESEDQSS